MRHIITFGEPVIRHGTYARHNCATVPSVNSQLFGIAPRQSYPPEEWGKEAADFWKLAQ